ncbi:MAG: preprotein translocase subunit SecY [Candidatus Dojkabacteria bacterium]
MIQNKLDYEQFKAENSSERRSRRSSRVKSLKVRKPSRFSRVRNSLKEVLTNRQLVTKILVTLLVVLVYRALASIPLPGIDMAVFEKDFSGRSASEASYFFLIFTGNTLETPSIVGLGIAAYINASIIMQLLTPVIPRLTELQKDGARGQQVINQYTRYLTLPLSFMYSVIYILILSQTDLSANGSGDYLVPSGPGSEWPTVTKVLFMALILTAGSLFLMWLAEIITESGIGNGSSIIISIGILASLPSLITQDFSQLNFLRIFESVLDGDLGVLTEPIFVSLLAVMLGFLAMIVVIVFANESMRKIKIQYARRAVATPGAEDSHLPIKLTLSGVLPIIFASAVLSIPQLILPLLNRLIDDPFSEAGQFVISLRNSFLFAVSDNVVNGKDIVYAVVYFILIIIFGVFYAFISLKPKDTAENLQKNSAFIPGVRPGKSTEKFISKVLLRIGFAGAVFLAFLALLPLAARNYIEWQTGVNLFLLSGIGGTSILIVVSVVLDTYRQFTALRVTRSYSQYSSVVEN